MMTAIRVLGVAVALLIAGCSMHTDSQGSNGVSCHTESHSFLFFAHADMTCTDANGKVISSGSGGNY